MFAKIGVMTLILCTLIGTTNATVESFDPNTGSGTIGPGGCVQQ